MSELFFVLIERSAAGEAVLGVFSSLEGARALLPPPSSGRLEDYRIEAHVLDDNPKPVPWQITLSRGGEVLSAVAAVFCACDGDAAHFRSNSFIDAGGDRMHVIVLAKSAGAAVAMASEYHGWLIENGFWNPGTPIEPVYAGG